MVKKTKKLKIDKTDKQIISYLMKDSKMPYKIISKKLGISLGTVHVRIKKLERFNVIKNFTVNINYESLGYNLKVFIGLIINSKDHEGVVNELNKIDQVVEVHHTTGKYHMLAKIICENPKQLREIIIDKINSIEGVEKTETNISLDEIIAKTHLF